MLLVASEQIDCGSKCETCTEAGCVMCIDNAMFTWNFEGNLICDCFSLWTGDDCAEPATDFGKWEDSEFDWAESSGFMEDEYGYSGDYNYPGTNAYTWDPYYGDLKYDWKQ
jgi:hypothetical protein